MAADVNPAEADLWWAVVREAARDVLNGHESVALDGLEFLSVTGVWLCDYLWGVAPNKTRKELVRMVKRNPKMARVLEIASER